MNDERKARMYVQKSVHEWAAIVNSLERFDDRADDETLDVIEDAILGRDVESVKTIELTDEQIRRVGRAYEPAT